MFLVFFWFLVFLLEGLSVSYSVFVGILSRFRVMWVISFELCLLSVGIFGVMLPFLWLVIPLVRCLRLSSRDEFVLLPLLPRRPLRRRI